MGFLQNISDQIPIISFFISIILFVGIYQIGNFVCRIQSVEKILSNISDVDYLKHALGIIFLLIILYPIVLFFPYSKEILFLISIILLIGGVFGLSKFSKKIIFLKEFSNFKVSIFYKFHKELIFLRPELGLQNYLPHI